MFVNKEPGEAYQYFARSIRPPGAYDDSEEKSRHCRKQKGAVKALTGLEREEAE